MSDPEGQVQLSEVLDKVSALHMSVGAIRERERLNYQLLEELRAADVERRAELARMEATRRQEQGELAAALNQLIQAVEALTSERARDRFEFLELRDATNRLRTVGDERDRQNQARWARLGALFAALGACAKWLWDQLVHQGPS